MGENATEISEVPREEEPADGAAIKVSHLYKSFGHTTALHDVNLTVPEGAVYALVGANGAGKTTLIKVLMGILEPTGGNARMMQIECLNLAGQPLDRIGYVSENQELPQWMTVEGFLAYLRPFYPKWTELSKSNF